MKTLLLTITMLTSTIASALVPTPGYHQYSVVDAQYSKGHVHNPGYATLTVDLNESKVTLFIQQENNCPPNAMCILSMPAPVVVELPIVSVKQDGCGTTIITAKEDKRPVDGALELITVKDYSTTVCDLYLPHIATATYQTKFFNRFSGKEIKNFSSMSLQPFMTFTAEQQ